MPARNSRRHAVLAAVQVGLGLPGGGHSMWERKYGKKKKLEEKKEEKKNDDDLISKAKRYKSRTERELEKLGEGLKKGGKVRSKKAFTELTALAKRLETAITTGNKKRIREINAQLDSKPIPVELARGGMVKRYMKRTG